MSSQARIEDLFARLGVTFPEVSLEAFDDTDQIDGDLYPLEDLEDDLEKYNLAVESLQELYRESNAELGRLVQKGRVSRVDMQHYADLLEEKGISVNGLSITESTINHQVSVEALGGYAKALIGGVIAAIAAILAKILHFLFSRRKPLQQNEDKKEAVIEHVEKIAKKNIDIIAPDYTKLQFKRFVGQYPDLTEELLMKKYQAAMDRDVVKAFSEDVNTLQLRITQPDDAFIKGIVSAYPVLFSDLGAEVEELSAFVKRTYPRIDKGDVLELKRDISGKLAGLKRREESLVGEFSFLKTTVNSDPHPKLISDHVGALRGELQGMRDEKAEYEFNTFYHELVSGKRNILRRWSKTYARTLEDKWSRDMTRQLDNCRKNLTNLKVGEINDNELREMANALVMHLQGDINAMSQYVMLMELLSNEEVRMLKHLKKAHEIYNEYFG